MHRSRSRWAYALALVSLAACSDRSASTDRGDNGGTIIIVVPGAEPAPLLPPLADDQFSRLLVDQLYDRLAEIGPDMNTVGDVGFKSRLAKSWAWAPDSMSIAFAIDPTARWHDGQPVRAADVKFSLDLDKDPKTATQLTATLANIDSVAVRDSLTAVVFYHKRTPEQFYDFVYQVAILPQHVLGSVPREQLRTSDVTRRPIGSGRFRFVQWQPGQRIEIMADTANYRGRAKLDRIVMSFVTDPGAAITQLLTGQADYYENLSPPVLPKVDSAGTVRVIPYPGVGLSYLGMNSRDRKNSRAPHPIFGDRRVRRAITMALDRRSMLRNVFDTLGVLGLGPFTRSLMDTTVTQIPFDRAAGAALLDSAGWRVGADGMRAKAGRPLSFGVIVPTSSAFRMRYAVLIQEALKAVGIGVEIESMDISAWLARSNAHDFDASLISTGTDPARASVKQNWSTSAIAAGGQNSVSYSNPAFDATVDSAVASFDKTRADALYHRAFQTIVDDAPAVWLYDNLNLAGAHKRIRTAPMRVDYWWANLADWWIPANERIERDRIGLRAAQQ
ncbi:MAG TPA: peptide ABC transporter substrate-binding protein [Gemmatimonadaceae bacterium]|nr:peptide ABC transporter substrate-binding protein [Gemmatimonadaceae bacterium]